MLSGRNIDSGIDFLTKIIQYDNGMIDIISCEKAIFRQSGWEIAFGTDEKRKASGRKKGDATKIGDNRAIRRARARVREIAMANDFDYFVTLTLDKAKVDRYDVKVIVRKLSDWCDNQVRRYGLRYVLIPERHKDGAVHFHGFMSWDGLAGGGVVESGTFTKNGWKKPRRARSAAQAAAWVDEGAKMVYNLPKWTLGFSTAIAVYGQYGSAVGYVCKYVGKQMEGEKIGGRWYYSGGKLRVPKVDLCNLSIEDLDGIPGVYDFNVDVVGRMRIWRGKADDFAAALGRKLEDFGHDGKG